MSLTEKAAYLRGLYDGMEMNEVDSKEAKLLGALIDVVQELAAHVTENEASLSALADEVDDLSEILDDSFDDDSFDDDDFDTFDNEDEELDAEDDDDEFQTTFEVECPNCQCMLTVGEEELSTGVIECPTCGQKFQIELEFDDDGEMIEESENE